MMRRAALAFGLFLLGISGGEAKTFTDMFPGDKGYEAKTLEMLKTFDYVQGAVDLPEGGVKLTVPAGYYYVSGKDAARILTDLWGNPPGSGEGALGMIFPATATPADDTWGAIITFDADGYVSDEDAAAINYDDLLESMQSDTDESNAERQKQGFEPIKLIGWASPPFYDKGQHKLHWAKELEFGGSPDHTLNYNVRALGRQGVLNINFVAGMKDLQTIKQTIPSVMSMPSFGEGFKYSDYMPGADKLAAYGIGGLIAGKLAAKVGILAGLLLFLKKGIVLIIPVLAAIGAGLKKLFGGRSGQNTGGQQGG